MQMAKVGGKSLLLLTISDGGRHAIMLVRMTCMYEPDDLTETRMELLAAVSTDSDLYLAKVGNHNVPAPSTHKTMTNVATLTIPDTKNYREDKCIV